MTMRGYDWPSTQSQVLRDASATEQGWELFDQLYRPVIFAYCRRRGFQEADASDLTQEVMSLISVQLQADRFIYQRSRGRFRGWLAKIIRQRIFRFVGDDRKQRTDEGMDLERGGPIHSNFTQQMEQAFEQALDEVQQKVDADKWQVFELYWFKKLQVKQIASLQSLGALRVAKIVHEVKEKLRRSLQRIMDDFFQ